MAIEPEALIGTYLSAKKDMQVCVYKAGDSYSAKLCWLHKPQKDANNPDLKLKGRDLLGPEVGTGFKFDGKERWKDGHYYDHESGNTYSCIAWLGKKGEEMNLRCFEGIPLFGQTEVLTRVKDSETNNK